MKILLTGGGTAGHVTPLLAVASEIKNLQADATLRYVGKIGDPTSQLAVNDRSIEKTYSIFAGKLRRFHGKPWYWYFSQPGLIFHNIKDLLQFLLGFLQSLWILIFWRPDAIFVKGGFVGLPVGLAAAFLRIPIVTHDSDTTPGLTNRILSRYAHTLAVGAPVEQYPQYAQKNIIYTGVPIRSNFIKNQDILSARKNLGVPADSQLIVITGGSLGAVRMNSAVIAILDTLLMHHKNRMVYWLTGSYGYDMIVADIAGKSYKNQLVLEKFSDSVSTLFAAADIIISRAGATTLAEIAMLQKPAIIIPNPLLTGGHQVKNGKMYQGYNAASVLQEHELKQNPGVLSDAIEVLLSDATLRENYAQNLAKLSKPRAAHAIANIIIEMGSKD